MKKALWIAAPCAMLIAATTISTGTRADTRASGGWEYKTILRGHERDEQANWSAWASTEDDQQAPMAGTLTQQLNKLGSQGWELVTASDLSVDVRNNNGNNGGTWYQSRLLIFKRQKR